MESVAFCPPSVRERPRGRIADKVCPSAKFPRVVNGRTDNFCDCAECKIDGVRVPTPQFHRFHNCEYVRKRSALVPQAERIASETVAIRLASDDNGESCTQWTRAFATAMDALSAPLLNGALESELRDS
jgi:hypothetical protein